MQGSLTVSIYSPLICFLDIVSCRADDGLRTWAGLGCGAWGRMRVRVVALYWKSYRELYMVTRSIAGSSIWVDYWERIDSFCKCLCACDDDCWESSQRPSIVTRRDSATSTPQRATLTKRWLASARYPLSKTPRLREMPLSVSGS